MLVINISKLLSQSSGHLKVFFRQVFISILIKASHSSSNNIEVIKIIKLNLEQ
ncbi:hypothetical protein THERMOS_1340 [Bathymodiolus thermophilus thioautotrophic gill symbiont]|uniref:Uncharacterized protein n=1 Tax=Bathymodiolus thermophilus thioautotrophic gill symbiont TaxID=2360 RepID=A0A8H8XC88_9GAMM|nr:hypothetical protein THERMOS_1340 [Bathymodiolus thermophilus thioautotrophic gill symbiont]